MKKEIPSNDLAAVLKSRLINRLSATMREIDEDDWDMIASSLVDNGEVTAETLWPETTK